MLIDDADPRDVRKRIVDSMPNKGRIKISDDTLAVTAELSAGLAMIAVELRRIYELLDAQARAERAEGE